MKKEARIQAEKIFLKARGKITNREIAQAVTVNPSRSAAGNVTIIGKPNSENWRMAVQKK
jgi:hypothetical protein